MATTTLPSSPCCLQQVALGNFDWWSVAVQGPWRRHSRGRSVSRRSRRNYIQPKQGPWTAEPLTTLSSHHQHIPLSIPSRLPSLMSINHRDVILQLVREYQSFNLSQIEYRDSPPTALEFSRILRSNRPVVFRSALSFPIISYSGRFHSALASIQKMGGSSAFTTVNRRPTNYCR